MATEYGRTKYGDLFSSKSVSKVAGGDLVAAASNDVQQLKLADERKVILVRFDPDVVADEYPFTVMEYLPDGRMRSRVYTQDQFERVSDMSIGDIKILEQGTPLTELRTAKAPQNLAAPVTADDNSLQTEQEVKMATDPAIVQAMAASFDEVKLGDCPPGWKSDVILIPPYPLRDGRMVPSSVLVQNCISGRITFVTSYFPIKDTNDAGQVEVIQAHQQCTQLWSVHSLKEFRLKEVHKSSKLNFKLGLGFGPKMPSIFPKVGDQVFKDNKPLTQPSEGGGGAVDVKFDFGLIRQYMKITLNAFHRLDAETGQDCVPK